MSCNRQSGDIKRKICVVVHKCARVHQTIFLRITESLGDTGETPCNDAAAVANKRMVRGSAAAVAFGVVVAVAVVRMVYRSGP